MRAVICFILLIGCAVALKEELPPGYTSPSQLTSVLGNEPTGMSFESASSQDSTITFGGSSSSGSSSTELPGDKSNPEIEEIKAEFDPQIDDVRKALKKLRLSIKETQACARRLGEQRAQLESLEEQKEHLAKEMEKAILEAKLQKQMRDLAEIEHMSRTLGEKFNELKRTQQVIKTRMTGTRSSLNQLDSEPAIDFSTLADTSKNLGKELDEMHKTQSKILGQAHKANKFQVKQTIHETNSFHEKMDKQEGKVASEYANAVNRQA